MRMTKQDCHLTKQQKTFIFDLVDLIWGDFIIIMRWDHRLPLADFVGWTA
jgi:hypothetical protein